ncbi:unnamed protein product [Moneuplotes crassus]|uniref:Uncharacterized protein n=1 Tax=Euplotes crassus TaxID=5936 RepID=A0AAD2D536_EUPCR|nr:unnamed protein product [Moneuplotes crassus]
MDLSKRKLIHHACLNFSVKPYVLPISSLKNLGKASLAQRKGPQPSSSLAISSRKGVFSNPEGLRYEACNNFDQTSWRYMRLKETRSSFR